MANEMINVNSANLALNGGEDRFVSFVPETKEDVAKLYNAMSTTDGKVSSLINKTITLCDVVVENILMKVKDKDGNETGEVTEGVLTRLILKDGSVYTSVSNGLARSLRNLAAVMGTLHFPGGLDIQIIQTETPKGRTFGIKLM